MENKTNRRSAGTVIYLLLAALLAAVIFVTFYTISSHRSSRDPIETVGETTPETQKPQVRTPETTSGKTTPETNKPENGKTSPETDKPTSGKVHYFVAPLAGEVSKEFEIEVPVFSLTMNDYRSHTGVDIAAKLGSEVGAVSDGTVCSIKLDPMMGRTVTIDHGDNIFSTYMNLANDIPPEITVGSTVKAGQVVGVIGDTSLVEIAEEPHLHLEMKVGGKYVDPMDYLKLPPVEVVSE